MKRFVFRLAKLERLRDVRRREARARLVRALDVARDRESEREDRERAFAEALAAELPPEMASSPADLARLSDWRDGRRRMAAHAARRERVARTAADEAAGAHTEAARNHRVLERLRERRYRRWRAELEIDERKFLDEVHQLRLVRKRDGRAFEE